MPLYAVFGCTAAFPAYDAAKLLDASRNRKDMDLLDNLPQWFEKKPLVLLRFPDGFAQVLLESRRGFSRFTFAKPHSVFDGMKLPTLCLAGMAEGSAPKYYIGVAKSKTAVTTFESRLTVVGLKALNMLSLDSLMGTLADKHLQATFRQKLEGSHLASSLSPKLSAAIVKALSADPDNRKAIEAAACNIPKLRKVSVAQWEQLDAIKTAMATFGLSKTDIPHWVETPGQSDSTLNYLDSLEAQVLEDNVIAKDASVVPGFDLIEKQVTGRAVFTKGDERLEVYTANRGPLEEMLGVDLIYINDTAGNTLMLQYKMLEPHTDPATAKTDWLCRPDEQMRDEIARMKLPPVTATVQDYRLHRNPFFFKFIRRQGDGDAHQSIVLSLDHLNELLLSPKCKGPKGGVRISFDSLEGVYLRETDLIGLIQSGYIGTHRIESDAIKPLIRAVSEGKRGLVLAWQKRIAKDAAAATVSETVSESAGE